MSIPLPALDIKPPQQPDPLGEYAKMLSVKSMISNQKSQKQQQTLADQQITQGQRTIDDQNIVRDEFMKNNGDLDKTLESVVKRGVAPQTIQALQLHRLDVKKKMADLTKDQLANLSKQSDMLGQHAQAILSLPPEQRPAAYAQSIAELQQNGTLPPGSAPAEYPGDDWVKFHATAAMSTKDQVDKAMKQREEDATLPGKKAKSQSEVQSSVGQTMGSATDQATWAQRKAFLQAQGIDPSVLSQIPDQYSPQALQAARMLGTPADKQEPTSELVAANRSAAGDKASTDALNQMSRFKGNVAGREASAKLAGEMSAVTGGAGGGSLTPGGPQRAPAGVTPSAPVQGPQRPALPGAAGVPAAQLGQVNERALQNVNPAIASQVKAIAQGRIALPGGFALRSAYWQNMLRLVTQYDPSFDAVNYNARAKTRQDFTSGRSAQQVNALNTVIGHLDQLKKKTDELDNTNWQTLNSAENWLSQKFGSPKVTNFQAVVKSVSDELVRVWRGTGGSEADVKERLNELSSSNSPAQLHGAIAEIGHLLESKLQAMQNQNLQGMGIHDIQVITPESRKVLDNLETKPGGTFQVKAPNGKTYNFKSQAEADAFKAKLPAQ